MLTFMQLLFFSVALILRFKIPYCITASCVCSEQRLMEALISVQRHKLQRAENL